MTMLLHDNSFYTIQITVIKMLPQTSGFNRIYEHEIELARAGVGKVRPAGQIRPAEALNTARGVVFSTQFPYISW